MPDKFTEQLAQHFDQMSVTPSSTPAHQHIYFHHTVYEEYNRRREVFVDGDDLSFILNGATFPGTRLFQVRGAWQSACELYNRYDSYHSIHHARAITLVKVHNELLGYM